ncbi:hypothetical protein Avbf_11251, partial [Armadillidium vulgare]
YTNAMNEKIQRQIAISNPFQFKHISNLKVCSFDKIFFIIVLFLIMAQQQSYLHALKVHGSIPWNGH